jgi:hypothetical protein
MICALCAFVQHIQSRDRLCGLVARLPGHRSRGPWFDSRPYQIFWEVVGLERGPLSLVSTIEELLGRNSSGSGLENREYGRGDPLRWPCDTLYPQKFALTSPKSSGRSVGIVSLRTKVTEFFFIYLSSITAVDDWVPWLKTMKITVCHTKNVTVMSTLSIWKLIRCK